MAFCPGCGYGFREGIRHCPDCDLDLVADLDEVDANGRRRIGGRTVKVFAARRAMVETLAEMLDEEGVPSLVKAAGESPTPGDAGATLMAELHVSAADAQNCADLIQELIAELDGDGQTGGSA